MKKFIVEPGNKESTVLYSEHKLESKVDHDVEFALLIYNHDDAELHVLGHFVFTISAVITIYVKPNKVATSSTMTLTLLCSTMKSNEY